MARKKAEETIPVTVQIDIGSEADATAVAFLMIDLKKKFLVGLSKKYKDSDDVIEALHDELLRAATEYIQTNLTVVVDDVILESVLADSLR